MKVLHGAAVFDNPSTTGCYDDTSGGFSSDCFGALLQAVPQNAADLSDTDLRDGQVLWATVDAPWLHKVDQNALASELDSIRNLRRSPAADARELSDTVDSP